MSSVQGRVAALVMTWVLPACSEVAPTDEGRFDSEIFDDGDVRGVLQDPTVLDDTFELRGGTLLGDMGQVRDFEDESPLLRGWTSAEYTNLEVIALNEEDGEDGPGAAMAILAITGDLADPSLRAGSHLEFNLVDYPDSGVYVNLIGCSGPVEGDWQFDQGAETVVLDITEGTTPDARTFEFTGTFIVYDDAGSIDQQVVVGSVEVGETRP